MKLSILILALTFSLLMAQQPEGYDKIDSELFYFNEEIQDHVEVGAQYVLDKGIENGNLLDTEYYITQIYGIYKQELPGQDKVNYAFDVKVVDLDGSAIRVNFLISYFPSTEKREITSYTYDEGYYINDLVFEFEDSNEDLLSLDSMQLDVTPAVQGPEIEWLDDIWFVEDEVVDEKGRIVTGNPTSVSLEKFNADAEAQNLFIFGLEEVLEQIVPQEIAVSQFHIHNIYNVTKQVVNGITYTFDAEVENNQGIKVRVTFEVYSQAWTGALEVLSYSYDLTNSDGSVVSGEESFIDF